MMIMVDFAGTFKATVEHGKTYLLRIVSAAMNDMFFFSIANHTLTVVGTDGSYTKPLKTDYITISPGQTMDVLLEANQLPNHHYYMAARVYHTVEIVPYDKTITTAIINYKLPNQITTTKNSPFLPFLPSHNDTNASVSFTGGLRSLISSNYDNNNNNNVPKKVNTKLLITFSMNSVPCEKSNNSSCKGPGGERLKASTNNVTFVTPKRISILEAYYGKIKGVYEDAYPNNPPLKFNFTADNIPGELLRPKFGTNVKVIKYNSSVEIVLQGTSLVSAIDHPVHLHGHSFYVVGWGFGNFDNKIDPLNYNLVDPPLMNTIAVPKRGWTAIRFTANNPGKYCY